MFQDCTIILKNEIEIKSEPSEFMREEAKYEPSEEKILVFEESRVRHCSILKTLKVNLLFKFLFKKKNIATFSTWLVSYSLIADTNKRERKKTCLWKV